MRHLWFLFLLSTVFLSGINRVDAQETNKIYNDAAIWPEAELIYITGQKSYITLGPQFRYNTSSGSGKADQEAPWSSFQEIRLSAAYQNQIAENWRVGFGQRIAFVENLHRWYSLISARHAGKIGSVSFLKRGLYEHIRSRDVPAPGANQLATKPENRVRGSLGLERAVSFGSHTFVPGIEYEVLFELGQDEDRQTNPPRRIDRTRLRLELGYYIGKRSSITFYGMRETSFYNFLEQYDEDGNVAGGGKTNVINPVYGLEYRYNIKLTDQDRTDYRR